MNYLTKLFQNNNFESGQLVRHIINDLDKVEKRAKVNTNYIINSLKKNPNTHTRTKCWSGCVTSTYIDSDYDKLY